MTLQEMAKAFAHENGRRTRPMTNGKKFSIPDPDLYWGLEEGFLAGAKWMKERMIDLLHNEANEPEVAQYMGNLMLELDSEDIE